MLLRLREIFINALIKVVIVHEEVVSVGCKQLAWEEFLQDLALELLDDVLTIDGQNLLRDLLRQLLKLIDFVLLLCVIPCVNHLLGGRLFFDLLLTISNEALNVFQVLHFFYHCAQCISGCN